MRKSRHTNGRRVKFAIWGFALGLGLALLIRWKLGEGFAVFEAVTLGFSGAAVALLAGERFWRLPPYRDDGLERLRDEMGPIDLKSDDAVPITLKSKIERNSKL